MKKIFMLLIGLTMLCSHIKAFEYKTNILEYSNNIPISLPDKDIKCQTLYCYIDSFIQNKEKTSKIISSLYIKDNYFIDCENISDLNKIDIVMKTKDKRVCEKKVGDLKKYFFNDISFLSFIKSIQISPTGKVVGLVNLDYLYGLNMDKINPEEFIQELFSKKIDSKALCLPWDNNGCRFTICRIDSNGERCLSNQEDAYCGPTCGNK
ncbi:MAG: hypothetical protein ACP5SD_04850 [Elusimicrobiales bacterium]